ncbi:MAG: M56 family metallopeptidase [Isosphaeraceae bacterium]|nr:M56 family metallopeptidase [Isosphaeraceae bacterium]
MNTLFPSAIAAWIADAPVGPAAGHWPSWVERIGWTLVHSVWELAAVALLAAIVDRGVRRGSANVRYITAAVVLGIMLVLPGLTWLYVGVHRPANPALRRAIEVTPSRESAAVAVAGLTVAPALPDGASHDAAERPQAPDPTVLRTILPPAVATQRPAPARERRVEGGLGLRDWLRAALEPRLPWLVGLWLAGVALSAVRPICGAWTQWRLRRTGLSPVPEVVSQTLSSLVRRMEISRVVRIAQSSLVRVPLVVGYLRPVILLPAAVVTGLTPAQLEAILAHELAHVRRHDWLINALQILAETVLFYHPAVWWISRRLRHARELCCDDVALTLTDNRAVFARALLLLEEFREWTPAAPRTVGTLAATGGQLSERIRRLLAVGATPEQTSRSWFAGALLVVALGIGMSLLAAPQTDSQPRPSASAPNVAGRRTVPANAATGKTGPPGKSGLPPRVVNVVDEQGRPVAGASVTFQFEVSSEHLSILKDPVKTDADGQARIEVPKSADRVWISVTAEGFGKGSVEESATGKSTIALKPGRVIRVRAVDSAKRVLKDAVPLLAGTRTWGQEFKPRANGVFQSPGVAMTRTLLRVAAAQEHGPMLFSDPVDISSANAGADGVFELTLRPGVRLEGRLDDSVPRPITEGYAELMIVEGERGKMDTAETWDWQDFTPVRPDGTFTFESLPGGGHAQLHVLVNGYISKNPPAEDVIRYLRKHKLVNEEHIAEVKERFEDRPMWPRWVPLDQPRVTVTVPCEPAAACDFRLLDPSGKPVPDANVNFNPNGAFFYGGLFIPGTEQSQALLVDGVRSGNLGSILTGEDPSPHGQEAKKRLEWVERCFLSAKSDADGRVHVRNLPGGCRERFHVTAEGLLLPVSPLLDENALARRNATDDRDRYGIVELVSGETVEKTIYLERAQPVVDRELIVVNRKGTPLPKVSLTLAELRAGAKDWQTWSTQRFGPLPRGTTDRFGRLTLRVPSSIANVAVQRVRIGVNFSASDSGPRRVDDADRAEKMYVNGGVVEVPLAPDDGVIMLLPDPARPNTPSETYPALIRYGRLEDLKPHASLADWLATMIKEPNVAVLRKLLAGATMKHPEPVELLEDDRRRLPLVEGAVEPDAKKSRVKVVSDGKEQYAIVEARVRPLSGALAQESDPRELPECAYVFDMQGNLIAALGGELGTTGSNSPDDVELTSLGPQEDWFVHVERWEKKEPFELLSTYYRVTRPIVNSLQLFHRANSRGWSIGPEQITRFGTLYFGLPEIRDEARFKALGTTANGAAVIPTLVWDGDRNRFVGAATQTLRGKPLYEVQAAWSQEFAALSPKANQLVIDGGERAYDYWHTWNAAVPQGCEALVTLSIPQRTGPPRTIERTLSAGRQMVEFQLKPGRDAVTATLKLEVGDPRRPDGPPAGPETLNFDLPFPLGDRPAVRPPIVQTLSPGETARLLSRSLTNATDNVTIDVKLLAR